MAFTIAPLVAKELLKLNLGCGHDIRPEWVNVDKFPATPDVVHANFPQLPFKDNVASDVFLSHVLEHFGYEDGYTLASEIHRVLAPSGVVQIEVPDIAWCMTQFLNSPEPDTYTNPSGDYTVNHRWGLWAQSIWGDQHNDGLYHKWGFTANRLMTLLKAVGFSGVNIEFVHSHGVQCLAATATK